MGEIQNPFETGRKPRYTANQDRATVPGYFDGDNSSDDDEEFVDKKTKLKGKEQNLKVNKFVAFLLQNLKVVMIAYTQKVTLQQLKSQEARLGQDSSLDRIAEKMAKQGISLRALSHILTKDTAF